jgi:hypothetical protein
MRSTKKKGQRFRQKNNNKNPLYNPEDVISDGDDVSTEPDSDDFVYINEHDQKQKSGGYAPVHPITYTLTPRERECEEVNMFRNCYVQFELNRQMTNQRQKWADKALNYDVTPRVIAINLQRIRSFLQVPFEYGQTCIHKPTSVKSYISNIRNILFFIAGACQQTVTLDKFVDMRDAPVVIRAYVEHRLNLPRHQLPSEGGRYAGPHLIKPYGTEKQIQPSSILKYLMSLLQGVQCFVRVQQYKHHPLLLRIESLIAQLGALGATKETEHKGLNFWITQCIRAREVEAFKLHTDYIKYNQKENKVYMSNKQTLKQLRNMDLVVLLTSMPVTRPGVFTHMTWDDIKDDKTNVLQYISTKHISHKTKDRYGCQFLPLADIAKRWLNVLKAHRLQYVANFFHKDNNWVENAKTKISQSDLNRLPIFIKTQRTDGDIFDDKKWKVKITPMTEGGYASFVGDIFKKHVLYKDNRYTNRQRTGLTHHPRRMDFDSWIAAIRSEQQEKRREYLDELAEKELSSFKEDRIMDIIKQGVAACQHHTTDTAEKLYTSTDSEYQQWVQRKKWMDPFLEYFHTQQTFNPDIFKVDISIDRFWDLKALEDIQHMRPLAQEVQKTVKQVGVSEKAQVSLPSPRVLRKPSKTTTNNIDLTKVNIERIESSSTKQFHVGDPELSKYCNRHGKYADCHYVSQTQQFIHNRYKVVVDGNEDKELTCRDRESLCEVKTDDDERNQQIESNIDMF